MSIKYSCDICGRHIPNVKDIIQWNRTRPYSSAFGLPLKGATYPIDVCDVCDMDIQVYIKSNRMIALKEENE